MPALRDSRISFPDADASDAHAQAPEKTADSSHVARRRTPSAPRQEFSVDEFLELGEDAPDVELVVPLVTPSKRSLPPPLPASVTSLAPVASDADDAHDAEPSFPRTAPFNVPTMASVPPPRPSKGRSPWPLAVAILACGVGVAAFLLRVAPSMGTGGAESAGTNVTQSAASYVAPPLPVATAVSTPSAVEAVAPVAPAADTTAPIGPTKAATGTVVGAEGHRLWVDGRLMPDWRADVDCGEHLVQVGSAGTPRSVDVRCDSEVIVSP